MSHVISVLPTVVAFAVHAALCITLISAVGTLAARLARRASAPFRHTLVLSVLLAMGFTPAYVALRHWQPREVEFLSATAASSVTSPQNAETSAGPFYRIDDEAPGPGVGAQSTTNGPISIGLRPTFFFFCIALLVWVVGALALLAREIPRLLEFRRLWSTLTPVDDARTTGLVERLKTEMGIRRHVRVVASTRADPFTVGWLRPAVVIPGSFCEKSTPTQLEAVLVHELAHIRRRDWAIHVAMRLLAATYWWNALVRRLVVDLSRSREEICDNFVLKVQGEGRTLASFLVDTAERVASARFSWSLGMSVNEPRHLEKRVTQLLSGDLPMIRISSMFASFILMGTLSIAALLVHADYAQAQVLSTARFIPLGDLPGGDFHSFAVGMSADGSTVVGTSYSVRGEEAFRWTEAEGMMPLGDLEGGIFRSRARNVSADGRTVVGFGRSAEGDEAIVWRDGVLTSLGDAPDPGFHSQARGVSDDGTKIAVAGREGSFVWTENAGFSPLGAIYYAQISGDGNVLAGGGVVEGVRRPAFYSDEGFVPLGDLPGGGVNGGVWSLSTDGTVVVGHAESHDNKQQAFRYKDGNMQGLGFLGVGEMTEARDVSADGSVVVGMANWNSDDWSDSLGFIWDAANGMRDIQDVFEDDFGMDLGGYRIMYATGISANGQFISGTAETPSGAREAYLADLGHPVPEPSSGMLAACGLALVGAFLLRKRRGPCR